MAEFDYLRIQLNDAGSKDGGRATQAMEETESP